MRHLKMVGLVVIAVLLACVGTVSANPLTSPEGTAYTSTLSATSTSSEFDGPFITVKCSHSTFEGKVEAHSATSAEGKLSSFNFSGCNFPVTVLKAGSLKVHAAESKKGTVTSSGAEISVETNVGTCVFSTSNTDIGTLTDTAATKGNAVLDLTSTTLFRTGGSFLCGTSGTWTGNYTVTAPSALHLDSSANTSSPVTSPEGTPYTGTIKAESEGATKFDGSFSTVECSKSSFEAKIEAHDPSFAEGKVSGLAFGECNYPVEVLKPGSLQIHTGKENSGTATWIGAEIRIKSSLGDCAYLMSGVDVGVITDSSLTKGNATLDLTSAKLTRLGGKVSCSASATWTGSYKIPTPSTLYLHGTTASPLTSPEGTPYTSTLKAESTNFALDGPFTTVACSSSLEAKVETHSFSYVEGKVSSFSFSSCNFPVSVLKPGSLKIHDGEGTGTVTSSGAEISINTSVGTCVFTTSATDVGTITDTATTGSNALLDLSGGLPRTGGSFLCGSAANNRLTGSFKVTTPSTLYVDA